MSSPLGCAWPRLEKREPGPLLVLENELSRSGLVATMASVFLSLRPLALPRRSEASETGSGREPHADGDAPHLFLRTDQGTVAQELPSWTWGHHETRMVDGDPAVVVS